MKTMARDALQELHDLAVEHGATCGEPDAEDEEKGLSFHDKTARVIQKVHNTCAGHGAECMRKVRRPTLSKATPSVKKLIDALPADQALDIIKREIFSRCTSPQAAHRMTSHNAENWLGGNGNRGLPKR
jgi:hypothetical protein